MSHYCRPGGSLVIILAHVCVNLQLVTVSLPQPMCILLVSNVSGLAGIFKMSSKSTVSQHWNGRLLYMQKTMETAVEHVWYQWCQQLLLKKQSQFCFLAKKQQNALEALRKEDAHKLMKLCCSLSARHSQNSCRSPCQASAVEGRRNCQNPQEWSKKLQSKGKLVWPPHGEDCH